MIKSNVPRKFGLEEVIRAVLASDNPLFQLATNFNFYPASLVEPRVVYDGDAEGLIREKEKISAEIDKDVRHRNLRVALDVIAEGGDYLDRSTRDLKDAFWGGTQEYYLLHPEQNAYNPSFSLVLFPRKTVTINQKMAMMAEFSDPHHPPLNYEHIKSILITSGGKNYLAIIKDNERVNGDKIRAELGAGRISLVNYSDVPRLVGRPLGAVGPLIHESCYRHIACVFFGNSLLEDGYSQPHYNVVVDNRSVLVLSDLRDAVDILKGVQGYPETRCFDNLS